MKHPEFWSLVEVAGEGEDEHRQAMGEDFSCPELAAVAQELSAAHARHGERYEVQHVVLDKVIPLDVWTAPNERGTVTRVRFRSAREILADLASALRRIHYLPDEYLGVGDDRSLDIPIAGFRWVACYAVTGGSEGYYLHIDLIGNEGRALLILGKTLSQGMEWMQRLAAICALLLGA